jgi:hypothetical protein
MKKIFTLIAMALMAVGASAQSSWVAPESAPAAGMSIIKDDLMKVETVFETTCGKILDESNQPAPVTFAGKTFETYMQIRVDAAPTNDAPTGTEKSGSTPLVITAKKNVDLTIYYRRQAVDGAYSENDGKDIKLPTAPMFSTNDNGFMMANNYQAYAPLKDNSVIKATASDPAVTFQIGAVSNGRAIVKATYKGYTKNFFIN